MGPLCPIVEPTACRAIEATPALYRVNLGHRARPRIAAFGPHSVPDPLVRPLSVVVCEELVKRQRQAVLAEQDHPTQALLLDRRDPHSSRTHIPDFANGRLRLPLAPSRSELLCLECVFMNNAGQDLVHPFALGNQLLLLTPRSRSVKEHPEALVVMVGHCLGTPLGEYLFVAGPHLGLQF